MLTSTATAVAAVLVAVSIDFGRLVESFTKITALPVVLAVVLLIADFVLALLRFEWTLVAVGVTRAVLLQASGVPMTATVAATYLERLIALATIGVGAALSALALFGSFGFVFEERGAYFLSVALAISSALAFAGFRYSATAIRRNRMCAAASPTGFTRSLTSIKLTRGHGSAVAWCTGAPPRA